MPEDLDAATRTAWELVGSACHFAMFLNSATNPLADRWSSDPETLLADYPGRIAHNREACRAAIAPLSSEFTEDPHCVYSDGEFTAECAHVAAIEFANKVLLSFDTAAWSYLIASRTPRFVEPPRGEFLPPEAMRGHWAGFVDHTRRQWRPEAPGCWFLNGLPNANRILAHLVPENRRVFARRRASGQTVPVWTDHLQANQWGKILGYHPNRIGKQLRELAAGGLAEKLTVQKWRLKVSALSENQRQRYEAEVGKWRLSAGKKLT
jgi:hypothetical protein